MRYFRNGVIIAPLEKFSKEHHANIFSVSIEISLPPYLFVGAQVAMCKTCHRDLKNNLRPKLNYFNVLQLDPIPVELLNMSDLEQVLISKDIVFIKLWKLPKSRMNAITDKAINVPITDDDIIRTVSQLPRLPHDAGIIAVDFKRKTDMKSSVLKEYVDIHRLGPALTKLKELGHPGYQFIKINADYLNTIQEVSSESCTDTVLPQSKSSFSSEDFEYDSQDPIRKHQFDFSQSLCFTHTRPEITVISNTTKNVMHKKLHVNSKSSFIIAPGQSKIPTSL